MKGPEGDGASELAHMQFDRLAGIDLAKRARQDRLPRHLLKTIQKWFVDSDADDLVEWSHRYVAHGGDPPIEVATPARRCAQRRARPDSRPTKPRERGAGSCT